MCNSLKYFYISAYQNVFTSFIIKSIFKMSDNKTVDETKQELNKELESLGFTLDMFSVPQKSSNRTASDPKTFQLLEVRNNTNEDNERKLERLSQAYEKSSIEDDLNFDGWCGEEQQEFDGNVFQQSCCSGQFCQNNNRLTGI